MQYLLVYNMLKKVMAQNKLVDCHLEPAQLKFPVSDPQIMVVVFVSF